MLQSIKDELTEPFVFIYITLYFPWFYLCSRFKKGKSSSSPYSPSLLHNNVIDSECFNVRLPMVQCYTKPKDPPSVVAAVSHVDTSEQAVSFYAASQP